MPGILDSAMCRPLETCSQSPTLRLDHVRELGPPMIPLHTTMAGRRQRGNRGEQLPLTGMIRLAEPGTARTVDRLPPSTNASDLGRARRPATGVRSRSPVKFSSGRFGARSSFGG